LSVSIARARPCWSSAIGLREPVHLGQWVVEPTELGSQCGPGDLSRGARGATAAAVAPAR
jgi:hypothetical protein